MTLNMNTRSDALLILKAFGIPIDNVTEFNLSFDANGTTRAYISLIVDGALMEEVKKALAPVDAPQMASQPHVLVGAPKARKKRKKPVQTNYIPNPGSDEALSMGCICAVMDNNHGEYPPFPPTGWFITCGCTVHGFVEEEDE